MSLFHPGQSVEKIPQQYNPYGERTIITPTADDGQKPSFSVTFADADATTQADHILFEACNEDIISVWLDIDDDGTAPSGAGHLAADAACEVDIVAAGTPETGAEVAAKVKTAIEAMASFDDYEITITRTDATLTIAGNLMWETAQPQSLKSAELAAGSATIAGWIMGSESSLNSATISLNNGAALVVGLDANGEGAATSDADASFAAGASADVVGAALATAIDSLTGFEARYDGGRVVVTSTTNTNVTDIADVDTGFAIQKINDGYAGLIYPSQSPASRTNSPSVIS